MAAESVDVWRARMSDLELVTPLFDVYRQFYEFPSDLGLSRRFLEERISRDESVIFLAGIMDREALGFTQLYPTFGSLSAGRVWILYDLFVAETSRRSGIARMLMERAEKHAVETRAGSLVLQTARTNAAAQQLYESLGYKRDQEFLTYELTLPRGGG